MSKVQGRESLIFQTYVTFSIDFSNIYNDYLLANVIGSFFFVLVNGGDFFRKVPKRFSSLLFMFLWILFLTKYDKIMYRMSKRVLKKRFSLKERGSNETLGKVEADLWMYPTRTFDFGLR